MAWEYSGALSDVASNGVKSAVKRNGSAPPDRK
jgi:hypothetical protein